MLRTGKGQYSEQGILLPGAYHNAVAFGQLLSRMWTLRTEHAMSDQQPHPTPPTSWPTAPQRTCGSYILCAAVWYCASSAFRQTLLLSSPAFSLPTRSQDRFAFAREQSTQAGRWLQVRSRAARCPQHVRHQSPGLSASCVRGQRCPLRMPEPLQTLDACACSTGQRAPCGMVSSREILLLGLILAVGVAAAQQDRVTRSGKSGSRNGSIGGVGRLKHMHMLYCMRRYCASHQRTQLCNAHGCAL